MNSFSTPYTEIPDHVPDALFYQSFIGVDLHKTTVTLVAVAPDGTEIARLTINTKCREKITAWLFAFPRPSHLAVEAVGFVEWFIDDFRPCVDRIDIADATELANRRGKRRKNDCADALDMAQRLARGECPWAIIADDELMQLRKLGRHWRQLSSVLARSQAVHEVHPAGRQSPRSEVRRRLGPTLAAWPTDTGSSRPNVGPSPTSPASFNSSNFNGNRCAMPSSWPAAANASPP